MTIERPMFPPATTGRVTSPSIATSSSPPSVTRTTRRRAILAILATGLGAGPARAIAGLGATQGPGTGNPLLGVAPDVVGLSGPDPIFAVIAEHKAAIEAWLVAANISGDMRSRDPGEGAAMAATAAATARQYEALHAVLTRQPATVAGAAALLHHVGLPQFLDEALDEEEEELRESILTDATEWDKKLVRDFPTALAATMRSLIGGAPGRTTTSGPDPVYAAIDRHRVAAAQAKANCSRLDQIGTREALAELDALHDVEMGAASEMKVVEPTTLNGVMALLRHAAKHSDDGAILADFVDPSLLADALEKIAVPS